MASPFRFDTVLRIRIIERDRCRLALAQEKQREAALLAEQHHVQTERLAVLEDLRSVQVTGDWPADRILLRQQHSERLAIELIRIDKDLKRVATTQICLHQELFAADTSVKALEKLAGRHDAEQRHAEFKQTERDREDTWRAA